MTTILWRYDKVTGLWVYDRECADEAAANWLTIFQNDSPTDTFRLSRIKPNGPPKGAKPANFPTVRNMAARIGKRATLSAAELSNLIKQVEAASSRLTTVFIEAGRGHWRPNNEISDAAKAGDAMAAHYVMLNTAKLDLYDEEKARLRYHGGLRPIKRVAV